MNGSFSFAHIFPSNSVFFSFLPADAQSTEELDVNSDHEGKEQPTAGAPSTCWGLSLFLLPSVILVGLLI